MKLDKYIGQSGFTSRRKAWTLIDEKRITVNGKVANFSTKVNEGDTILIDGVNLVQKEFVATYIAYHKPKGIECTTEKIAGNIIDAIGHPQTIYPIGRLDKASEGLILLTNQAALINQIANSAFGHEKEYIVTLNLPVRKQFLREISEGVELDGVLTRPCKVKTIPNTKRLFSIVLTQGLNRQIRRMCALLDYQVVRLQRIRVMHIELGNLKSGEWRDLTQAELDKLFAEVGFKQA